MRLKKGKNKRKDICMLTLITNIILKSQKDQKVVIFNMEIFEQFSYQAALGKVC